MRVHHYIKNTIQSLLRGELFPYVRNEWSGYKERRAYRLKMKRREWWDRRAGSSSSVIEKLPEGVRIELFFDSELCRLIHRRNFEIQERNFVYHFLRPGDIFVDIGANIGLFTLIAAKRVGKEGRVYAFEPTTKTFHRLIGNVHLNGFDNVFCYKSALSEKDGFCSFMTSRDGYDAWNSFGRPIAGNQFETENVATLAWDSFAKDVFDNTPPIMMKIDVEGWECKVLSGGEQTLSKDDAPVLQIEFTDAAAKTVGSECKTLYNKLKELGYKMFSFDEKHINLIPEPIQSEYQYINLLAIKNERFVVERLQDSNRCVTH